MKSIATLLSVLLLVFLAIQTLPFVSATEEVDAEWGISIAENRILDCYEAVAEADEAGANVTDLLVVLEKSGRLLSRARLAYSYGDFDSALNFSDESRGELNGFLDEAWALREEALESSHWDFMVFFVGSLLGGGLVVIGGFMVWFLLKRRFGVEKVAEYGLLFVVVVGITALAVASPGLSRVFVYPKTEFFTELWILDSEGRANNYPYNISSGKDYEVILGIGNHLGHCGYYQVMVKFHNLTESGPDIINFTASDLQSLFNISVFVEDEKVWQRPLTFSFDYECNETAGRMEFNSLTLNSVELDINDYIIQSNSTDNRFFGYLFFELWLYNTSADSFHYHERFVGLRLNMTVSS